MVAGRLVRCFIGAKLRWFRAEQEGGGGKKVTDAEDFLRTNGSEFKCEMGVGEEEKTKKRGVKALRMTPCFLT